MITIFFVPGMFGSTLEYLLRAFTDKFEKIECDLGVDGSMHTYEKEFHPGRIDKIISLKSADIATPIYPFKDDHFPEVLRAFQDCHPMESIILLHADSLRSAELNMLFQYHKVANGAYLQLGLEIFCGDNTGNIINWNKSYTHWSQMKPWEVREWLSLFYVSWVQEWIDSQHQVSDDVLKISNTDMLFNTKDTVERIFNFCGLTTVGNIDPFINKWAEKQQYIVDEFCLLDNICNNTVNNVAFEWSPINVIAEAIVQQRLRALGFEIRCDGLNTLPTDSKTLYDLLERC